VLLGTRRFLREARAKVRANAVALSQARRQGLDACAGVLARLEELSAAKAGVCGRARAQRRSLHGRRPGREGRPWRRIRAPLRSRNVIDR
jgi:hypothetical protein